VKSVGSEVHTINPKLHQLATKAVESEQPTLFTSISDLCESTTLLSIVIGILERIKAKGLDPEELALLEQVAPKVAQLRTAINARAEKKLQRID
jgi:Zn-dependent oligopeptidase